MNMFIVEKRNNLLVKCSDRSPVGTTPTKSPTPQPTFEPTVSALQNFLRCCNSKSHTLLEYLASDFAFLLPDNGTVRHSQADREPITSLCSILLPLTDFASLSSGQADIRP